MHIDEFAHALGEVFCGAPLGDLHLAPGAVPSRTTNRFDGAVAAVLAVVALDLPGLGRDRLAHLADELDRALVEADHRPLAGRAPRHRGRAHPPCGRRTRRRPAGMHHIFLRHGLRSFSASRRRTVSRDRLVVLGQLDHLVGQQLQRPARAARRRVGAGGRHQQGFLLAGELALRAGSRLLAQRPFQIAFDEPPLGPIHRRAADRRRTGRSLRRCRPRRRPPAGSAPA